MKTALIACSKRSDSVERCEVKKAMKSRGGLGREALLFFRAPFYFATLPTLWTPGTGYPIRAVVQFLTKNSKLKISREILSGCQRLWSALHQALIAKQKKKKLKAVRSYLGQMCVPSLTWLSWKWNKVKIIIFSIFRTTTQPSFIFAIIIIIIIIIVVLIIFILIIIIIIVLIISSSLPSQLSPSSGREVMALVKQDHKRLFVKNQLVVRNFGARYWRRFALLTLH